MIHPDDYICCLYADVEDERVCARPLFVQLRKSILFLCIVFIFHMCSNNSLVLLFKVQLTNLLL